MLDRRRSAGRQARIASRLPAEAGPAVASHVGEALSRHFRDQLDAVSEAAQEAASFFSRPGRDEGWDCEAAVGLAQLDLPDLPSSDQARSAAAPVRPARSGGGRAAVEALAMQADDLAAFAAFADLEDAFEPMETQVRLVQGVRRRARRET